MANKLYLLTIEGGVHPEVDGPYADEDERHAAAERLHATTDPETDAVLKAEVTVDGALTVDTYAGGDFADVDFPQTG